MQSRAEEFNLFWPIDENERSPELSEIIRQNYSLKTTDTLGNACMNSFSFMNINI